MITIDDFEVPKQHPFNMLEGYKHAYEKEQLLSMILSKSISNKEFSPITTLFDHPAMVEEGLLIKVSDHTYLLTEKAKGLLYSVYHKKE